MGSSSETKLRDKSRGHHDSRIGLPLNTRVLEKQPFSLEIPVQRSMCRTDPQFQQATEGLLTFTDKLQQRGQLHVNC